MRIRFTNQVVKERVFFYLEITTNVEGVVTTADYELNVVDITSSDVATILMQPSEFARMMEEHPYLNFQMVYEVFRLFYCRRKSVVLRLTDSVHTEDLV
jgi:hypothetical protein